MPYYIKKCIYMYMKSAAVFFRLLGDEGRLRILRLLRRERLNVSELTSILGAAQPGVSRNLRLLREAGLVEEERERGWTYFHLRTPEGTEGGLWEAMAERLLKLNGRADDARLREVLRQRKEEVSHERGVVPGKSWAAWARALGHLLPPLRVADLGCGEGQLTAEIARWASRVIAVDVSEAVLERARARNLSNVVWKRGEIEDLPIQDESVDLAILSQALHHAEDVVKAMDEASRIVVRGGSVLVLDLRTHDQEWVRRLGDRWMGFEEGTLRTLLIGAGLRGVRVETVSGRRGDPFQVVLASGRKLSRRRRVKR